MNTPGALGGCLGAEGRFINPVIRTSTAGDAQPGALTRDPETKSLMLYLDQPGRSCMHSAVEERFMCQLSSSYLF